MADHQNLKFKLTGQEFHEISPEIKFSNMNAMAFVSRIQNDLPDKIDIEFDGESDGMMFLMDIAGEIGYFANIEGNLASFERV